MPEQIVHIHGVFPTVISISALVLGLYERKFRPAFPDLPDHFFAVPLNAYTGNVLSRFRVAQHGIGVFVVFISVQGAQPDLAF